MSDKLLPKAGCAVPMSRSQGCRAIAALARIAPAGLLLAASSWAQTPAAAFDAAAQTVDVTATRVKAAPFDIPASIDRIGGDAVREGRPQINISESLGAVPGLLARDRQNYAQDVQLSVRGFGARSTFGIRGVRLYVDGIPATFPDGQGQITNVDLGSVDRIEVLRGPYSALYGNSSGGVLQVFTEDGAATPALDFSVAGGSDGTSRVGMKLSGTRGALGYVLGASHFQTDGSRAHSAAERNLGNVKLTLRLDDASTLTLIANSLALPKAQDPLGLTRAQFNTDPRGVDPVALKYDTRKHVDQSQGGLVYERRLDAANTLRVLVYAGHRNTEQFQAIPDTSQGSALHPGGVIALAGDYSGTDLRWTLRGALAARPFTLVAGLAYDTLDQHRLGYQNFVGPVASRVFGVQGALRRDENDTATNVDEYLQATLQLASAWSLSAGVRHSSVRFDSKDHYIVGANGDDSGAARYGATLPVLGLMYALSSSVHLYATAGRGFETPTFNELAYRPNGATGLNFDLQPARSDNLEAGVKLRLAHAGEMTAALFQTRTQKEIVTLTNLGGRSTYQNAGATQRSGLELGWSNSVAEHLRAQVALSYLDASYRDAFLSCNAAPCTLASRTTVPAGNRIPGVARGSLYAALAWVPPLGWRGGVEGRYLSSVFVNDANDDAAPRYFVASANVGYVARIGAFKLSGFVRGDNLFGRRYAGSVIVNEGNGRYFEPAPWRTWLAGVSGSVGF